MLNRIIGVNNDVNEVKTALLRVWGKTIIFERTIYSIPNLSVVEVGEVKRTLPVFFWILILAGLFFLLSRNTTIYGIVALGLAGYWAYQFLTHPKHGLRLVTNSGEETLLVSSDMKFLENVAGVLYNIMNNESQTANYTVNFDQRTINEIGNMTGSAAIFGSNQGNVAVENRNVHPIDQ